MTRMMIKLGLATVMIVSAFAMAHLYFLSLRQRERLNTSISDQQSTIENADKAIKTNDKALKKSLAKIARMKTRKSTPMQIVKELPQYLSLPQPLTKPQLHPGINTTNDEEIEEKDLSTSPLTSPSSGTRLPDADISPLLNFAQGCRECDTRLAAAQKELLQERRKDNALAKERDIALEIAKGGSLARRIRRDVTWFTIGALGGYLLSKEAARNH